MERLRPTHVKYACACGYFDAISSLYFCINCHEIKCWRCVVTEVSTYFCKNCSHNLPPTKAAADGYRCSTCLLCPSCFSILTTRSAKLHLNITGTEKEQKKFYLACNFCYWTSRNSGIPDQIIAFGAWPKNIRDGNARIQFLYNYYKMLICRKEQAPKTYSERYRCSLPETSKFTQRNRVVMALTDFGKYNIESLEQFPAKASEEVQELPPEIFIQPLHLFYVTTLSQRLAQVQFQPTAVSQLYPIPSLLSTKDTKYCKKCQQCVRKPHLKPGSAYFNILHSAYFLVPRVYVLHCELLIPGKQSFVTISLENPMPWEMVLSFAPLVGTQRCYGAGDIKETDKTSSDHLGDSRISADIQLPTNSFIIPRTCSGDVNIPFDKTVTWSKSNKTAVKIGVTPLATGISGENVQVKFSMKYTFQKQQESGTKNVGLKVKLLIDMGNIQQLKNNAYEM